jgi:DNA-binding SARP family transcriptional activator/Mg2+ and Co2+ transporter CorA
VSPAVVTIVPPARGVWLDLDAHTERVLEPGAHELDGGDGFVWVDVELPAPGAIAALTTAGLVPAGLGADPEAAGTVASVYGADHLQLSLTGARLDGDALVLDRREIVVTPGAVVTVHRGLPTHFEDLRERYRDGFPRFARTHGFLIFELVGHLTDGLKAVVRGLGDRIDELRMAAALPGRRPDPADGSDLLASVLVMRRVLARTRDVLSEISSRRSPFVPETTQPYLHDVADRLDGLVADLAFSRDVLDEALRLADAAPAAAPPAPALSEPAEPRDPAPRRPPVAIASLGGFEASRGGVPVTASELGGERARELLAALLAARRPVAREQLLRWLWPGDPADRATRALSEAVAGLRRALDAPDATAATGLIAAEGSTCRVALGPDDAWDVDDLLRLDAGALGRDGLADALERYGRPFCPEWPHADWAREVREDCARALAALRARLAETLLEDGKPDEAIAHFEALVEADPENEEGHRGVMRSHADAGRLPLALRQFHACRSVLRQTQGVDPGPETQALYLELLGRR